MLDSAEDENEPDISGSFNGVGVRIPNALVETRGVEPLSENPSAALSTSVDGIL